MRGAGGRFQWRRTRRRAGVPFRQSQARGHRERAAGLPWTDNGFVRAELDLEIGSPDGAYWDNTQVLDFDGDGVLDLVNAGTDGRLRVFQRLGGVPDQLIRIGYGSPRGRTEIQLHHAGRPDRAHPGHLRLPADLSHQRRQRGGGAQRHLGFRHRHRAHLGPLPAPIRGGAGRPARPGMARVRQAHRHPGGHRRDHGDRVRQRDPRSGHQDLPLRSTAQDRRPTRSRT